jgi:DNA-nicking Smr family endonuclease
MASPSEGGAPPSFIRNGYPPDLPRKLRRGEWRVEDELDLHGLNRTQAASLAAQFLDQALARKCRCVRIVHGKGEVLREMLRAGFPLRASVVAFTEAPADQGGSGAMLVLLKA